jgi:hypothetical protein
METSKNLLYSFLILIPFLASAKCPDPEPNSDPDPKNLVERRRNIVKVFEVRDPDLLSVDNQYGQVKVNLWTKKDIRVEIVVTANAPSDERASEYLNAVEINEQRVKNQITLTTNIDKKQFGGIRWNMRKGEKNFIQIDYTVYMPKKNPLIVRNVFGDTDIPSFLAPLVINSRNGSFSANYLENAENKIDVQYGNARIVKMDGGKMDCQYSTVALDHVNKLILNNKFGHLSIGDINNLDADIDYSGAKIGTLRGTGKIKLNYSGSFKIEQLTHSSQHVEIQAAYSSVVLPAEANSFNVTVTYGKFSYPEDAVNFSMQPSASSQKVKQYQGKVGAGSGTRITITSRYGDVKLKQ